MYTSTPETEAKQPQQENIRIKSSRLFSYSMPIHGWVGLALNLLSWASSWSGVGLSHLAFFPLWFGFILFLDGLNYARKGHSPLSRSKAAFALLFAASAPFWWVFEFLNLPVQNWRYHMDQNYSPLAFFVIATLDFSTVLPAVVELTELWTSFEGLRPRLGPSDVGPRLSLPWAATLIGLGVACGVLPFLFPRYTFGMLWLCLFFLLDPISNLARRKSAFGHLLARDWRFFIAIPLATLTCGFFWEMWNSQALPKWTYSIPFVNSSPALLPIHLFEMPLIGYTGYLPFALELFAMYQFILLIIRWRKDNLTY